MHCTDGLRLAQCRCWTAVVLVQWHVKHHNNKQFQHAYSGTLEGLPPQIPPADPTPAPQPQLGLQEYQLRQLASLLGSANMAALQNMTLPGPAPSMPGTSGR